MHTRLEQLLNKGPTEYLGLERHLKATLKPVSPRPEFVGDLQRKLTQRALHPELDAQLENGQVLLIIAVSLLSVVLVVVMSVRAIAMLASAIGMLQHIRRQAREERGGIQATAGLTRGQA